jgi:hypothetical protein
MTVKGPEKPLYLSGLQVDRQARQAPPCHYRNAVAEPVDAPSLKLKVSDVASEPVGDDTSRTRTATLSPGGNELPEGCRTDPLIAHGAIAEQRSEKLPDMACAVQPRVIGRAADITQIHVIASDLFLKRRDGARQRDWDIDDTEQMTQSGAAFVGRSSPVVPTRAVSEVD